MPVAQLINADCLFHTCFMADNSVDAVVTDPPYALTSIVKRFGGENAAPAKGNDAYVRASAGFMGQTWDTGKVAFDVFFWSQVLRVLKPGGHVLAFSGSRTYHRLACAIEDAGFEIRDQIMWLYGSGFPKSHNEGEGWGTALKPAHEPIVMGRKPLIGTVATNRMKWGTGAINIDGCRVGNEIRQAAYTSFAACSGNALGKPGTAEARRGTQFAAKTYTGRFPANVIHDGSDEVIEAFPNAPGQQGDLNETGQSRPSITAYGDMPPPVAHRARKDSGSAARFFYCAKASKSDREEGLTQLTVLEINMELLNKGDSWEKADQKVRLLVDTAQSPPRVIAASDLAGGSAWNTMLFGNNTTGQSQKDLTYTTVTETNSTTLLKTLNCLVKSVTNENTPVANFSTVSGANPVENAEFFIPRNLITNEKMVSALGVDPAASNTRLKISVGARANIHATVKPTDLMRYLCRLVTPPEGIVYDPFMGSGSTGKAAMLEGFNFVGVDQSEEYFQIARQRIVAAGGLIL